MRRAGDPCLHDAGSCSLSCLSCAMSSCIWSVTCRRRPPCSRQVPLLMILACSAATCDQPLASFWQCTINSHWFGLHQLGDFMSFALWYILSTGYQTLSCGHTGDTVAGMRQSACRGMPAGKGTRQAPHRRTMTREQSAAISARFAALRSSAYERRAPLWRTPAPIMCPYGLDSCMPEIQTLSA